MNSDIISIEIQSYKELAECTTETYAKSRYFDIECGISYYERPDEWDKKYFYFNIIDKQKYFLAKIKYGI